MKTIAIIQFIQYIVLFECVFLHHSTNNSFVIGQQPPPILCPVCGGDFNQEMTLLDIVVSLAFLGAPNATATCGELAATQVTPTLDADRCDLVIGETALQDTCGCRLSNNVTSPSSAVNSPTNSPALGQVPTITTPIDGPTAISPTIAPGTTISDIPTSISPSGLSGPPAVVNTGPPVIGIPTITPKPIGTTNTNRPTITFQPTLSPIPTSSTEAPTSSTDAPATISPTTFTPAPILVTAAPIIPTAAPILATAAPIVPTLPPVLPTAVPTPTITAAPVVVTVPTTVPQPQPPNNNITPQNNIPPSRRKPENSSQRMPGRHRQLRLL